MTDLETRIVSRVSSAQTVSRRAMGRLVVASAATALAVQECDRLLAQEATPPAEECVATAPPADASGIAFAQLLVGGMVPDMPTGPVEVRLSRLTMAPGTTIDAEAFPFPSLMYIETGTTACPGGAGRVGYGPDGSVIEVTTGESVQYTPAGSTQYIPANVADGAGNKGPELMSSLIIEFVPLDAEATPTS